MNDTSDQEKEYQSLIKRICAHYAKGETVQGDAAVCEAFLTPEENRRLNAVTRMTYFYGKFADDERAKPIHNIINAFAALDDYFEKDDHAVWEMESVLRGIAKISKYLSDEDKERLRPKIDVINAKYCYKREEEKQKAFKNLEKNKYEGLSAIGIIELDLKDIEKKRTKKGISEQEKQALTIERSKLAYKLFKKLEEEIFNPETGYEKKVEDYHKMVKTAGMINLSRTNIYKMKENIYKSLSELHYAHGDNVNGFKAKVEQNRFHKAWNNVVSYSLKNRQVTFGER